VAENRQPFDEQAVLRELEQLHHKILASRKDREHAVARFDSFVKGFRTPAPQPAPGPSAASETPLIRGPWVSDAPAPQTPRNVTPAVQPSAVVFVPPLPEVPSESAPIESGLLESPPPQIDPIIASLRRRLQEQDYAVKEQPPAPTWRSKSWLVLTAAAAAVAIVALMLFALFGGGSAPSRQAASAPQATPPAASQPAAPAGPVSTHALRVELTTLRAVWLRVTVDDNKTLERQVPAGQRIPFEADRAIAVRAGDAGAVRVTVDGRDLGILGADGQVVTRAFTPSPSATDRVPR
jgi:cytoskeleton protein RodZ